MIPECLTEQEGPTDFNFVSVYASVQVDCRAYYSYTTRRIPVKLAQLLDFKKNKKN